MQEFLDLPSLVAVLQWFLRLVSKLAEWVLWITDRLNDNIQGFTHDISVV